jgi:prostaglandin-E synthase
VFVVKAAMSRHPEVLWAQRTDKVLITIALPDPIDPKINVDASGKLEFSAKAGADKTPYELDLELAGEIDNEKSKIQITNRHILAVLEKKEPGYWDKLLKGKGKTPQYIKVDWSKWVDEDEEKGEFDTSNMQDFSQFGGGMGGGMGGMGDMMGGMGGMGGAGGMDQQKLQEMLAGLQAQGGAGGAMGGLGDTGPGEDADSDDDDDLPELEKP